MIFATGTVSDIDERRVMARVRLPDHDNLRTAWLEVIQRNTQNNKDYWLPDIGEQVKVLLDMTGDDGVILGSVYSDTDKPVIASKDKRRTDFSDGAFVEYDRKQSAMTIGGNIKTLHITTLADVAVYTTTATVKATQSATVDSPQTTITGSATVEQDLTVKGVLKAEGGLLASGGSGKAVSITGDVAVNGKIDATGKITGA